MWQAIRDRLLQEQSDVLEKQSVRISVDVNMLKCFKVTRTLCLASSRLELLAFEAGDSCQSDSNQAI